MAAGPIISESRTIAVALVFLAVALGFFVATAAGAGPWLLRQVTRQQVFLVVALAAAAWSALPRRRRAVRSA